jgi:mannose-1-phosphate guanylyltransferase
MKHLDKNHYAVIMAGGIGSRFWPLSTKDMPKQFLDILGIGQTLLQITFERFKQVVPSENIFVITHEQYESIILKQLPEITSNQIIKEPQVMNTAPCVAFASNKILAINPNATMIFAPSDHLIIKENAFFDVVDKGLKFAENKDVLITIGIKPNRPDTGYGYIQYVDHIKNADTNKSNVKFEDYTFEVKTFTEKPDLELAKTFVESGDFLWNAGIFIWNANSILKAFDKLQPEMSQIFKNGKKIYNTPEEESFIKKVYPTCKSISIDYAIMEKADNVFVIPGDLGWSDLGTWKSLFEIRDKSATGKNVIHGQNILEFNTSNSLLLNQETEKLVVVNDADNLLIVNTKDVLLVCNLDKEQEVKMIVNEVRNKFKDKYI